MPKPLATISTVSYFPTGTLMPCGPLNKARQGRELRSLSVEVAGSGRTRETRLPAIYAKVVRAAPFSTGQLSQLGCVLM